MDGSIYIIRNNCNNKVYVGQTTQRVEERFKQHLKLLKTNKKQLIHKAICKYGKSNFYYEVLSTNIKSLDELDRLEEYFIKKYNSVTPNGYNLCGGGKQPRNSRSFSKEEEDYIVTMYKEGKSTRKIAEEFKICRKRVSRILKNNGCAIRNKSCNLPDRTSILTREILVDLFICQNKSVKEIAEIFNLAPSTVRKRISTYNLREYNTKEQNP